MLMTVCMMMMMYGVKYFGILGILGTAGCWGQKSAGQPKKLFEIVQN
jgi:hypothetical protein